MIQIQALGEQRLQPSPVENFRIFTERFEKLGEIDVIFEVDRIATSQKSEKFFFVPLIFHHPVTIAFFLAGQNKPPGTGYKNEASHGVAGFRFILWAETSTAYDAMNSVWPWRFTSSSGSSPAFFIALWNSETFFTGW